MVLAQFEPTESKCQKWLTIVKWKREVASFFFQVIQWLANDNRSGLLLSSAFEWMNDILSVQRREKGSKIKFSAPCPKIVKLCKSGMGGVDLMDQRTAAYCLDWKSSVRFYPCIFFDLMDIACFNSYLVYNMKHPNKLLLLNYKIAVAKNPNSVPSRPEKDSTNVEII